MVLQPLSFIQESWFWIGLCFFFLILSIIALYKNNLSLLTFRENFSPSLPPSTSIPPTAKTAPVNEIDIQSKILEANNTFAQHSLLNATITSVKGKGQDQTWNIHILEELQNQPHTARYLSSLHTRDLMAKLGMDESSPRSVIDTSALLGIYNSRLKLITKKQDQVVLEAYFKLADSYFEKHGFRKAVQLPWQTVASIQRLEQGMPFTLGDVVVMPYSMIRDIVVFHEKDIKVKKSENGRSPPEYLFSLDPGRAVRGFLQTLIHEKWHIIQRMHQDFFNEFYGKFFPFLMPALDAPMELLGSSNELSYTENPDSNGLLWYYIYSDTQTRQDKQILPYMALVPGPSISGYRDCTPVQSALFWPNDEPMIRIPLDSIALPWQRMLPFARSEMQENGQGSLYHPNEMFASWMTMQLLNVAPTKLRSEVVSFLFTFLR
jgi:hypothetical protein